MYHTAFCRDFFGWIYPSLFGYWEYFLVSDIRYGSLDGLGVEHCQQSLARVREVRPLSFSALGEYPVQASTRSPLDITEE